MKLLLILFTLISISGFTQTQFNLKEKSSLQWEGYYLVGGGHHGVLDLSYGIIMLDENSEIIQGGFVMEMATILSRDGDDGEGSRDLDDHLRSSDFFDVKKFPKANFSITSLVPEKFAGSSENYMVTGLLTLKGITESITFPATIFLSSEGLKVTSTISLNRTKWDVIYNSKSFFAELKDGIIKDNIDIVLDLVFEPED